MAISLQVQSVIYNNEKDSLLRALRNLANAIRVDREGAGEVGEVTVLYGDASPEAVFSGEEIAAVGREFAPFFRFRYIFFGENTGSAKGHNRLGAECSSDYLMIMNPDVIVSPRFFSGMLRPLLDPSRGVGMTEARQTPLEHPKEYNRRTLETAWSTTACVIFSAETFRAVGGFDSDTFFLYCDDVDFSWRVRLLGKKLCYCPDCPVYHAKRLSGTGSWQPTSAEVYYSLEASLLMAYKWSFDARFHELLDRFSVSSDPLEQKVYRSWEERRRSGRLPQRLDPSHRVGRLVGENYAAHRYTL